MTREEYTAGSTETHLNCDSSVGVNVYSTVLQNMFAALFRRRSFHFQTKQTSYSIRVDSAPVYETTLLFWNSRAPTWRRHIHEHQVT